MYQPHWLKEEHIYILSDSNHILNACDMSGASTAKERFWFRPLVHCRSLATGRRW